MSAPPRPKLPASIKKAESALVTFGLSLPDSVEEWPWGHRAFKVRKKSFTFLVCEPTSLKLSAKLRESHAEAMHLPFTEATGYNLGKAGWVSASFEAGEEIPVGLLTQWMAESYRLIAPKTLSATVET